VAATPMLLQAAVKPRKLCKGSSAFSARADVPAHPLERCTAKRPGRYVKTELSFK